MRLVMIESPYSGDVARNEVYLDRCLRHCLRRGDAPFASHAIYTRKGVLDDSIEDERDLGMAAGWAWMEAVKPIVLIFEDYGITPGMKLGIERAASCGCFVQFESIGVNP